MASDDGRELLDPPASGRWPVGKLIGCGCLVVLAMLAFGLWITPESDREPAPEPPPEARKETDPVRTQADGVTLTVLGLREVDRMGDVKPGAGFLLVVANVGIANAGPGVAKSGPKLFRVKEASGQEADAIGRQFSGRLTTGELKPGDTVRGLVAFEVRSAAGLTLFYTGGKSSLALDLTH